MSFYDGMEKELNAEKSVTTNGAIAYKTSGKKLLDFNFGISAMRNMSSKLIQNMFMEAYYEEPSTAICFLFWVRDCRGGLGERRIFRECFKWVANNKPEVAKVLIYLVPEYGRWDDLWCLLDTELKNDVIDLISKQLKKDLEVIDGEIV